MQKINVSIKIRKLKKVLLHRPCNELLNLTPDTLSKLLFDDIPYLEDAKKEHKQFAKILTDNDVEVIYLEDLMTEVLDANPLIKTKFIYQFISEANIKTSKYRNIVFNYLNEFKNNKTLVLKTMEGIQIRDLSLEEGKIENSLVDLINPPDKFIAEPMPNLYFTRDNFASVGEGITLNKMYSVTRNRETIYAEYIFKYHPEYKDNVAFYYSRYNNYHTEGGDLLNLNDHIIVIGISQRTEADAIDQLAKNFFKDPKCKIDTILAFNIPKSRAFMHLDTVFTQVDYDKFVYHPGIMEALEVFEITESGNQTSDDYLNIRKIHDSLENILAKCLKREITLIPCAGGDKVAAEREQWSDGTNTLAIAPGVVIAYDRNSITNEILKNYGIKVLELHGSELSRGRGGPRCMSMPLVREDV